MNSQQIPNGGMPAPLILLPRTCTIGSKSESKYLSELGTYSTILALQVIYVAARRWWGLPPSDWQ